MDVLALLGLDDTWGGTVSMTQLGTELLSQAIAGSEQVLADKRRTHSALTDEIQRLERELRLLQELRSLRGDPNSDAPAGQPLPTVVASAGQPNDDPLTACAIEILRANGQPMHIQDLAASVRERGAKIPGKGANANLIGHLRSSTYIVRPVRGMYALRAWGFSDRDEVAARRATRRDGARSATRRPAGPPGRGGKG